MQLVALSGDASWSQLVFEFTVISEEEEEL
jgi:hypothetical protein